MKAKIQTMEWGAYLKKYLEGPDMAEMSWNPSIGDPDHMMYMLLSSDRFPPAFNAGFYQNPRVAITLNVGGMITALAGLSFLGLGVQPPVSDWGSMLASSRQYINVAPHVAALPGLAIFLAVLGFNVLGDGLRDALDPRLR